MPCFCTVGCCRWFALEYASCLSPPINSAPYLFYWLTSQCPSNFSIFLFYLLEDSHTHHAKTISNNSSACHASTSSLSFSLTLDRASSYYSTLHVPPPKRTTSILLLLAPLFLKRWFSLSSVSLLLPVLPRSSSPSCSPALLSSPTLPVPYCSPASFLQNIGLPISLFSRSKNLVLIRILSKVCAIFLWLDGKGFSLKKASISSAFSPELKLPHE